VQPLNLPQTTHRYSRRVTYRHLCVRYEPCIVPDMGGIWARDGGVVCAGRKRRMHRRMAMCTVGVGSSTGSR